MQKEAIKQYFDRARGFDENTENNVRQALDGYFGQDAALAQNAEQQTAFRSYANARVRALEMQNTAQVAERKLASVTSDIASKRASVEQLTSSLNSLETRRSAISIVLNVDNIVLAVTTFVWALLTVIYVVWVGGIGIDVFAWLITGMLALEYSAKRRLASIDPPGPITETPASK
jgi:hypothetical protein